MTREEARHIIDNLKPTNTKSSFDAYVVGKALTMAIQALSQEPCIYDLKNRYCPRLNEHGMLKYPLQEPTTPMSTFDIAKQFGIKLEPCDDAISREELLKAIDTWDKFGCDADTKLVRYQDHYIPYIHYDDVIKCIKGMPSVTQKPDNKYRKEAKRWKSKWLKSQKSGKWIYDETLENWRCSKCNETPKTMGYVGTADFMAEHFKFCNHCGAKMEREEISERNMKMWEELFKAERGGKE